MSKKFESAVTVTLVLCALIMTGVVLRREFMTPAATVPAEQKPVYVKDWRTDLSKGIEIGSEAAPVQLIEFADFECPYCGIFHKTLASVLQRYPTQVTLTYVHFPIPGHRFALPAARVAECAAGQGHFEQMYDRLFEEQESFGLKPWSDYATAAGVPDLAAFDDCVKKSEPLPRVEQGKQLGAQLDVRGTPTLIVNGWKLGHVPTADELDSMVKAVLAGKSPIPART